jgi:hypothetical protein
MLLHVPASLDGLLVLLRPCFSQPTFQTFRGLLVGQVCQTGQRTVCGMLVGARLSGVWHHARAHRFFSHARWRVDELGLRIAELVVARLCEPDAPVLVAVDDTLLHRLGRKVHGTFWHHDATANSRQAAVAWGNNWVVVGIVVRPVFLDRAVCLPVLFRLWQPKRKEIPAGRPDPQRPSKPALARELIDLLAARLTARTIHVVGDAAYATSAARGLPGRVTMTSRLRSNAALYAPAPPRTGKRGRPATWGARLANLAAIAADPATAWTAATVRRYTKTETVMLHEIDCLWGPLGAETPVRVILIQDTTRASGYQIALITTDPHSTPAEIVERYADRWPIEVCYEDDRGRDRPLGRPPAQIPACASNALGSCLGCWRRTACRARDAQYGRAVAIVWPGGACVPRSDVVLCGCGAVALAASAARPETGTSGSPGCCRARRSS